VRVTVWGAIRDRFLDSPESLSRASMPHARKPERERTMLNIRDIAILDLSHSGLIRFACGCLALSEGYRDRAIFWHRRHETHPVDACCHERCSMGHRCGATAHDGTSSHRGTCGPVGPERPAQPAVSPTPDSPPADRLVISYGSTVVARIPGPDTKPAAKPVRKPAQPAPKPVLDDGLDDSWDGLLNGPQPVSAGRR